MDIKESPLEVIDSNLAIVERDGTRIWETKRTRSHRFVKYNGYPISMERLQVLEAHNVDEVHILELDDETRYEVPVQAYRDGIHVNYDRPLAIAPLSDEITV